MFDFTTPNEKGIYGQNIYAMNALFYSVLLGKRK